MLLGVIYLLHVIYLITLESQQAEQKFKLSDNSACKNLHQVLLASNRYVLYTNPHYRSESNPVTWTIRY